MHCRLTRSHYKTFFRQLFEVPSSILRPLAAEKFIRQFLASLFVTLWVVCGKANFTNLSRYGDYSERTYRRHYRCKVEFMAFHVATIVVA